MVVFDETGDAIFLCSPRLESMLACKSVYLGDFEAHDSTKGQLLSSSLRLNETTLLAGSISGE